jgi:hypothetical protein
MECAAFAKLAYHTDRPLMDFSDGLDLLRL